MKFRVEHDALADAVAWVARALPSRPVVPVLSGLRLAAGDGLTLSCFDYELAATADVAAEVAEPGTALVPGRLLAEIVRSLPGQPAEFTADGDMVGLTCGSAEFALVSLPLAEYPELPPTPPVAGTIDGGELAAAVAQVLPAASRDDTLPMLTGICLDISGEFMSLVATDRYRLAVRKLRWEPADPGLRAIALVPARTLMDAARTMTSGDPVPVAFVRPCAGAVLQEATLRASCLQQLARFKVPERIVMIDDFPVVESPNGSKVQKVRLREIAEALLGQERDHSREIRAG